MPAPGMDECEDWNSGEKNYEVYNCDLQPRSLPNFKQCDLNGPWPYPDNWADVILSVEVIEHLENPWHHLREAKRVLKPSGVLILTTPNILSKVDREKFLREGIFTWFPSEDHINPIPKWEVEAICRRLDLEVLEETYAGNFEEETLILKIRRAT